MPNPWETGPPVGPLKWLLVIEQQIYPGSKQVFYLFWQTIPLPFIFASEFVDAFGYVELSKIKTLMRDLVLLNRPFLIRYNGIEAPWFFHFPDLLVVNPFPHI